MKDLPISSPRASSPAASTHSAGLRATLLLERYSVVILALLLLVAIPAVSGSFRLGLFAKYLSFAFCAAGLVLTWGDRKSTRLNSSHRP